MRNLKIPCNLTLNRVCPEFSVLTIGRYFPIRDEGSLPREAQCSYGESSVNESMLLCLLSSMALKLHTQFLNEVRCLCELSKNLNTPIPKKNT